MKLVRPFPVFATIFILGISFFACKKHSNESIAAQNVVTSAVKQSIRALGFDTTNVILAKGGYVVEGDIFLSAASLYAKNSPVKLNVGKEEQYRTTNLILGMPRTITVSVENFPAIYTQAADQAIAAYNGLGLKITFQRVAANGDIRIVPANLNPVRHDGNLGLSAGFPTPNGDLPNGVTELDPDEIAYVNYNTTPLNYVATTIAHEIGHDIGFRHTDYFNRSFSGCLVDANHPNNEGDGGVGAIYIPGTNATEDPGSWMLACISPLGSRPFNQNDIVALNFLYGPSTNFKRPDHIRLVINSSGAYYCSDGNTIVNDNYYYFEADDAAGNPVWPTSDITITCNAYVNGYTQSGYTFFIGSSAGLSTSSTFNGLGNCNGPQDEIYGPFAASDGYGTIPVQ